LIMWERAELKMRAKIAFRRNYWSAVLVAFVLMLVGGGAYNGIKKVYDRSNNNSYSYTDYMDDIYNYGYGYGYGDYEESVGRILDSTFGVIFSAVLGIVLIVGVLFSIFIGNPLRVGGNRFFIMNQTEQPSAKTLGYAFTSGNVGNVIVTMFLMDLYIFLWSLLLVIPGIVKMYEYMMVPYILAENPGMERAEVFMISKRMMDGHKWDAFVLQLSFIGWHLLSAMTWGIFGIFYTEPYYQATMAELYTWNREYAFQNGYIQ